MYLHQIFYTFIADIYVIFAPKSHITLSKPCPGFAQSSCSLPPLPRLDHRIIDEYRRLYHLFPIPELPDWIGCYKKAFASSSHHSYVLTSFVLPITGTFAIFAPKSRIAASLIRFGCSPSVAKRNALLTVTSDTPNRLAKAGTVPRGYKILCLYLIPLKINSLYLYSNLFLSF